MFTCCPHDVWRNDYKPVPVFMWTPDCYLYHPQGAASATLRYDTTQPKWTWLDLTSLDLTGPNWTWLDLAGPVLPRLLSMLGCLCVLCCSRCGRVLSLVQMLLRSPDMFPDGKEESSALCTPHIVLVSLTMSHMHHIIMCSRSWYQQDLSTQQWHHSSAGCLVVAFLFLQTQLHLWWTRLTFYDSEVKQSRSKNKQTSGKCSWKRHAWNDSIDSEVKKSRFKVNWVWKFPEPVSVVRLVCGQKTTCDTHVN